MQLYIFHILWRDNEVKFWKIFQFSQARKKREKELNKLEGIDF